MLLFGNKDVVIKFEKPKDFGRPMFEALFES